MVSGVSDSLLRICCLQVFFYLMRLHTLGNFELRYMYVLGYKSPCGDPHTVLKANKSRMNDEKCCAVCGRNSYDWKEFKTANLVQLNNFNPS